jgi:hypothetical protein
VNGRELRQKIIYRQAKCGGFAHRFVGPVRLSASARDFVQGGTLVLVKRIVNGVIVGLTCSQFDTSDAFIRPEPVHDARHLRTHLVSYESVTLLSTIQFGIKNGNATQNANPRTRRVARCIQTLRK